MPPSHDCDTGDVSDDDDDGGDGGHHDNAANDISIFFLPVQKVLRLTSTAAWLSRFSLILPISVQVADAMLY